MVCIFDMGGVVTNTSLVEGRIAELLGITEEEFIALCTGSSARVNAPGSKARENLFAAASNGTLSAKEFWKEFSLRSGLSVHTDWYHWLFHPSKIEGTWRIIQALKENGNRVVCGTNTIESHYLNHMERGDYQIFDQTYTSFLMGVSKPAPEFWRIILTAENISPEDAIFIDDKSENCSEVTWFIEKTT